MFKFVTTLFEASLCNILLLANVNLYGGFGLNMWKRMRNGK